ncbi:MAG: biotin--[acetyl-CoA-carboxylase] ligase [Elusimicrobia bacterium]|nr:biotin--[acetyl-CoA-carboxylase] ligase [Elusimicrobiota bacterium]
MKIYVRQIVSTQDVAKSLAQDGAQEGAMVIADEQSAGRGRLGRNWESGRGGCYFSVVLRPVSKTEHLAALSVKTAQAVSEALKFFGIKTKIKHPNDVLAFDPRKKKFFKIAGILAESSSDGDKPEFVILGIGVNLNNTLSKNLGSAITAKSLLKKEIPRKVFLEKFFSAFWEKYSTWEISSAKKPL